MNYGDQQRQQTGQQQQQISQSSSHRAQIQQHNQQQQYGLSPINPNPSLLHNQTIGNIQSNMNISVPNTFNRQINQQILQSHFLDPHIQQQSHGIGGTIYSGQTNSGLTSPRIQQQMVSSANQYTGNTQQDQLFSGSQQNFFTHSNTAIPQQQQRYQTIINPMLQQSNISCQQPSLQQTPQVHQLNIHSQNLQQQSHQQNLQQHIQQPIQQQTYDQQQNIQRQNLQQHQNIQQSNIFQQHQHLQQPQIQHNQQIHQLQHNQQHHQQSQHHQQQLLQAHQQLQQQLQHQNQMKIQLEQQEKLRKEQEQRLLLAQQQRQQEEVRKKMKEQQAALKKSEEERIKKEAEERRIAEEEERRQREEEIRRKEAEELSKLEAEVEKRKEEAHADAEVIRERLESFSEPIHFAGIMPLTKIEHFFPFPIDHEDFQQRPIIMDTNKMNERINRMADENTVERLSNLLNKCSKIMGKISFKETEFDENITLPDNLPPLIKQIKDSNSIAFDCPKGLSSEDLMITEYFMEENISGYNVGQMENLEQLLSSNNLPLLCDNEPSITMQKKQPSTSILSDCPLPKKKKDNDEKINNPPLNTDELKPSSSGQPRLLEFELRHFKIKRKKKESDNKGNTNDRPQTPPEVLKQRQKDWSEWRKHQQEKVSRKIDFTHEWNNDVMAEKESFQKFCNIVDHILENVGEITINQDDGEQEFVLIERNELDELRIEVQKLRHWKQLHRVPSERLVKLMTILEKNIRDVLKGDCGLLKPIENFNLQDSFFKELVHERILRALDACCIALNILNSPKMPKQVYIEDTIEGAVMLVKQLLINYVYPAYDITMAKGSNTVAPGSQTLKKKNQDTPIKKKREKDVITQNVRLFFARAVELYDCFADLVRIHTINETIAVKILYLGTGAMFVNNVEELQTSAINILSNICSKYTTMRFTILQELLNTLHRLPTGRNAKNCFRLNATETVSNFTILVLQLVQSVIKVPLRKKMANDDENESLQDKTIYDDSIVEQSYEKAKKLATFFLNGFLSKLSQKGDDDYKKHFDNFLQDILVTLFKPEWPATELVLLVLCKHLIHFYRTKSTDMSLRIASLDYLGTITARLRKDALSSLDINSITTKKQIDLIVKGIVFDEIDDVNKNLDDIDISNLSNNEKHRKLMQSLVDYLLAKHGSGDVSVEYGILFYVGEWYKKYSEDYEKAKEEHQKQKNSSNPNERDLRKADKKFAKITDKFIHMKHFLINLADKKHLKKRSQHIRKTSLIMLDSDAQWVVRYMALSREFSQSFDKYLKHILYGVHVETAIGLRTKAMRCLTQIIDADNEVLMIPEVNSAVQARMMDQNAAVREATIDLVGKYLNSHIEFLDSYFNVLMGRIKDSSLAVRKRVIRILKDLIEKRCDLPQNYKIFTEMIRRVNDEESVKKLVVETFQSFWFTSTHDGNELSRRAYEMAKTMSNCNKEGLLPNVETLFTSLNKQMDKGFIESGEQIVDSLIDIVLTLDQKITNAVNQAEDVHDEVVNTKSNHTLLTGVLLTLSVFSCVKPKLLLKHSEVLLPYLSMKAISPSEIQVLKEVIRMLEKIVPLMDYPSDTFINALEERLKELVLDGGKVIIAQALSCMSAAYKKWKKRKPLILTNFLIYLLYLLQLRKKEIKKSLESKDNKDDKDKKDDTDRSFTLRAIYTIGIMAKCYDFDEVMSDEDKSITLTKPLILLLSEKRDLKDPKLFKETVHDILITFLKHPTAEIRLTALTSMGYFASEHSEYLTHQETKKMYLFLLTTNDLAYLKLKTQALQNLSLFLQAEDQKMAKSVEKWQENKEGEDLKEMEIGCSGLSSSIIQNYWVSVLNSYFNLYEEVRLCASQVVWQTLQQGLVTPGSSIPTLIAMTTDPQIKIRYRIENVLKEIDSKYTGMIPSKSVLGIRMASKLHIMLKKIYKNTILRGIRACDQVGQITLNEYNIPKNTDDATAKLSGLYSLLRTNRQQRRSFLSSTLRLFSEASKEKLSLEEWIFVADNLALFPYQVLDEPLYVINTADNIISLHGNDILANIKQMLLPKETIHEVPHMDEDIEFTAEFIYRRLPEDKSQIFELMNNRQACVLLHALKLFLMKMYGLNEVKVKEYSPSEQAKVYEKPVTRKNISIFNPVSCLRELHPDVIAKRNTIPGHIELSHEIVSFRTMLLTVDKLDDDESVIKSSPSDYAQSAPNDSESQDDYDD